MRQVIWASGLAGLLALGLSVMAPGATVAHAETGAAWKVNGTTATSALKAQLQVTELETLPATGIKELIFLMKTGLTTVEIHCTEMQFIDLLLLEKGGTTGKIHLAGCTTKLNKGAVSAACKPHSPGATEGLIEFNALTGLIVLHTTGLGAKEELLELKPSGATFVTLVFGKGECAIGSNFEVTGKVFLKAGTTTELKTETKEKLFSEGPLTALLIGGNAMTIDGSLKAALVAPHAGMTWGGLAD